MCRVVRLHLQRRRRGQPEVEVAEVLQSEEAVAVAEEVAVVSTTLVARIVELELLGLELAPVPLET